MRRRVEYSRREVRNSADGRLLGYYEQKARSAWDAGALHVYVSAACVARDRRLSLVPPGTRAAMEDAARRIKGAFEALGDELDAPPRPDAPRERTRSHTACSS